jgi:chromosome segregation ATPase
MLPSREQKEMQPHFDALHKEIEKLETENEELAEQVLKLNLDLVTQRSEPLPWWKIQAAECEELKQNIADRIKKLEGNGG